MGESDESSDQRSADEWARFSPLEPGQERRPVVRKLVTVVVSVVCVAALAGLAVWGFDLLRAEVDQSGADRRGTVAESAPHAPTTTSRGANEANVGDCVRIVKGGVDAELEVLECGTPAAVYRVGLELDGGERCPAGPYTEYSMIGMGAWSLCLVLDARPGQCLENTVDGLAVTDCAGGAFKVTSVLADKADAKACPPPPPDVVAYPEPIVYPKPPLTICMTLVPS
ncbi:MAG: hypothetical protein M3422_18685 [Actinomycetota bacterium]|nr:hypothetical protein [Actinomycetota bacterium]